MRALNFLLVPLPGRVERESQVKPLALLVSRVHLSARVTTLPGYEVLVNLALAIFLPVGLQVGGLAGPLRFLRRLAVAAIWNSRRQVPVATGKAVFGGAAAPLPPVGVLPQARVPNRLHAAIVV